MSEIVDNPPTQTHISVRDLSVGYGERVVQSDLNFDIRRGSIFIIMGASGCGKSTVLRALIGLLEPFAGNVLYSHEDFWAAKPEQREALTRRFGVMYQGGALWSSMTVAENVALPLEEHTQVVEQMGVTRSLHRRALGRYVDRIGFDRH